ncbi:MAG: AbrB/MazE/SpoVT family DNA-binding domain-containing protein [Methanophagales archaeon]|nr:AbrB/MazE/SpoVT family DNA-binding domain-containing protein [Methanophagales archaeon]
MEEARKVQITGKSTYMITLPKKWALDVGLQPGSLVSLSYQDEGTLLLTPSTTKTVTSHKTLKLDGEKNGLRRDIIGAYVMGHQFIELNARTIPQEIRKEIQGICKGLIGSEIVEETKEKIVIYDILDPGEFTIDKGLKRMYALVYGMLKDLIEVFNANARGKKEVLSEIISREEEVDRVFLLISKQFVMRLKAGCVSKEDQLNLVEAFHYRLAADNLERIGDHTVKIANTFASIDSDDLLPRDITDKIAGVGRNSLDSVEKSIISLRRADVALAGSVLRENAKIRKSISVINQLKTDTSNALPIGIITDSISRIGDYAGNIAELAIDLHQL